MSDKLIEYERLWKEALAKEDIDERIPFMNQMDSLWASMTPEEQNKAIEIGAGLLRSAGIGG